MAVAGTLLGTATGDTSNTTIYATGLVTPTADALILVLVASSKTTDPDVPTLAGNGLTYVQVATVAVSAIRRVTVFRGMGATPVLGAITATFGNNQTGCIIHVCQFTGTDTSGTNGSGAVVQSVTNSGAGVTDLTVTLAALGSANNAAFGAFVGTDVLTAGGAFTSLGSSAYATPTAEGETEWALNQTAVFCDIAGTKDIAGIAVEVKAAGAGTQTVGAMDALGTATLPAPTVALRFAVGVLGTASLSSPTVARGAVSVTPAVLGTATLPAPTAAPGAISVGPVAALGTATVAALQLNLSVAVAALGTASVVAPTVIGAQFVGAMAALGTATLPAPQLNLSLAVAVLGTASISAPTLTVGAALVTPAALGTATLPAPVVAPGAVSVTPAALGTASVATPQLNVGFAVAALGPASVQSPTVAAGAVAITPAALGTASLVAPLVKVNQSIGPFALLGGATVPAPAFPVVIAFISAGTPFASTLNQASYSTLSWTPTANVLVLVAVGNSQGTAATIPTLTGNGLTWDQVATVATPAASPRVTVFRAWTGTSSTTGALTADFGGTSQTACIIHISEATGTSGAAANGGLAIAQSATGSSDAVANPSITLGTFGQASNGTYGAFRGGANPAAGAGFTALAESTHNSPTGYLLTEWRTDNDTSVNTVTASSNFAGIALEIQNIIVPGAIGPMAALGPASLPAPSLILKVAVAALGTATIPAPAVAAASSFDVLGPATLPQPTLAAGVIAVGPFDALGTASTAAPVLSAGVITAGALDALGTATLPAPQLNLTLMFAALGGATTGSVLLFTQSQSAELAVLGGASVADPQLNLAIAVAALGTASLADPVLGKAILPDALGTASVAAPTIAAGAVTVDVALLGGATLGDPQLNQSIAGFALLGGGATVQAPSLSYVIAPEVLGTASVASPQLNGTSAFPLLGGAAVFDPTVSVQGFTVSVADLGPATVGTLVIAVGSVAVTPAVLGQASVATPALGLRVAVAALGTATVSSPAMVTSIALAVLGTAQTPAPIAAAGTVSLAPARLGGASLSSLTVFTGYARGPGPEIGGQHDRPVLSGGRQRPSISTSKRVPELVS